MEFSFPKKLPPIDSPEYKEAVMNAEIIATTTLQAFEVAEKIETNELIPASCVFTLVPSQLSDTAVAKLPSDVINCINPEVIGLEIEFNFGFAADRPALMLSFTDTTNDERSVILTRAGGELTMHRPFTGYASIDRTSLDNPYKLTVPDDDVAVFIEALTSQVDTVLFKDSVASGESQVIADPQYPPTARATIDSLVERDASLITKQRYEILVGDRAFTVELEAENGKFQEITIVNSLYDSIEIVDGFPVRNVQKQGATLQLVKWQNIIQFFTETADGLRKPYDGDHSDMHLLQENLADIMSGLK